MNILLFVLLSYTTEPQKISFMLIFDLDREQNIPTFFSSLLFIISAILFYLLSQEKKNTNYYWLGLSGVFLFLAFDEIAKVHESIGDYTKQFIDASGYLYYPWFLSYSIFLIILGMIYIRFFLKMPRKVFISFMLAAIIFLTGAMGFDILGAKEASLNGAYTIRYCTLYTIEESLEMFGLIYLISILLRLLNNLQIKIKS